MSGTLYLVATPIGNLHDMSTRACTILQNVDTIACEDTRHTRHLLSHFGIDKPLIALHQHNENTATNQVIMRLNQGESVAYVSDAGTPLVADPGVVLVQRAQAAAIRVVPIPGASAVMTALSASGLTGDRFTFAGFIPSKMQARTQFLAEFGGLPMTVIFFETPHRIATTLQTMQTVYDTQRTLVIARELTKLFEEIAYVTVGTALDWLSESPNRKKGEFVLLLDRCTLPTPSIHWQAMAKDLQQVGLSSKTAAQITARHMAVSYRTVYRYLIDNKMKN